MTVPSWAGALARAVVVVALSCAHFGALFRLTDARFWSSGLGDWQDPYLLNFLLEHWYQSITRFTDPVSPPMFFPARGALGYSCSLILYAPFYVLVRAFVHPFQAYGLTLFLIAEAGTLCLYLLLRRGMRVSFVAVVLVTAYFATTENIMNGLMFAWSQRATVFLIPIVALLGLESRRAPVGFGRTAMAAATGCLAVLVAANDFPTGYLALLVAGLTVGPTMIGAVVSSQALRDPTWRASRAARVLLLMAVLATAWTVSTLLTGGFSTELFGIRFSSRHWVRPALVAAMTLAAFLYVDRARLVRTAVHRGRNWGLPFTIGVAAGAAVFLWIYVDAYREHPAFSNDQMMEGLTAPGRLPYESWRPFVLVAVVTALSWLRRSTVDRRTRIAALWFVVAAVLVAVIPLQFDGFSLWTTVFQILPGASAVRDPKRMLDSFDLALAIGTGLLLTRLPSGAMRLSTMALVAILTLWGWRATAFDFSRPNETFATWVDAPITIDPSCRAFFMLPASPRYSSRPGAAWSVYGLDAMFLALRHRIPTLNGYSGWTPDGWAVANPEVPGYLAVAARWIDDHSLTGVCTLDIERRIMRPFAAPPRP